MLYLCLFHTFNLILLLPTHPSLHTHTFHFSDSSTEMTTSQTPTLTQKAHLSSHTHKHNTQLQGLYYISIISALMVNCRGKQDDCGSPMGALLTSSARLLANYITRWSGSLALILETF